MYSAALQAETGLRIDRQITFGPSDTSIPINFTVIDDLIALEPTEELMWSLQLVAPVERASVDPFNTVNLQIVDDDGRHQGRIQEFSREGFCSGGAHVAFILKWLVDACKNH